MGWMRGARFFHGLDLASGPDLAHMASTAVGQFGAQAGVAGAQSGHTAGAACGAEAANPVMQ